MNPQERIDAVKTDLGSTETGRDFVIFMEKGLGFKLGYPMGGDAWVDYYKENNNYLAIIGAFDDLNSTPTDFDLWSDYFAINIYKLQDGEILEENDNPFIHTFDSNCFHVELIDLLEEHTNLLADLF